MIGFVKAVGRHLSARAARAAVPLAIAAFVVAAAPLADTAAAAGSIALKAISTPPPVFPPGARRSNKSGYVLVGYTVGTDGRVGEIHIIESEPSGVFDHVVETTIARWRFEPLVKPQQVTHTFYFDE